MSRDNRLVRVVLLAAGLARRYGKSKLLEHFGGRPILTRALDAAHDFAPREVYVVTGGDSAAVGALAREKSDHVLFNPGFEEGIGTSIACGVSAAMVGADAVILVLADQPLVTAAHFRDLTERWQQSGADIVATRFGQRLGPPVLFGPATFAALCRLSGDRGAREIIRKGGHRVGSVQFEPAAVDIDSPEDLAELNKRFPGS